MIMTAYDTTIEAKVGEFVADKKGFTSVDIGNAIKTDGTWVPNRDVAAWLRKWTPPTNYGITKVTVNVADTGDTAVASIYLPDTMAVADYTAVAQEAMKPEQFEKLHGFNPLTPVAPVQPKDYADGDDTSTAAAPVAPTKVGDKLRTMFKWPKTAQ